MAKNLIFIGSLFLGILRLSVKESVDFRQCFDLEISNCATTTVQRSSANERHLFAKGNEIQGGSTDDGDGIFSKRSQRVVPRRSGFLVVWRLVRGVILGAKINRIG